MRRWAFNIAASLSLLLCAAMIVLWVRSYWRYDSAAIEYQPRRAFLRVQSEGGVFCLLGYRTYAVFGTVGVILGAWYLLVMVQRVCFGPVREPEHGDHPVVDLKPRELAALIPIAAACLWIGIYPKTMLDQMRPDVKALVELRKETEKRIPK